MPQACVFEDVALPKTFLRVQALFKNFKCVFTKEADGSLFDMPSGHPFMPAAIVALDFTNSRLPKKTTTKKTTTTTKKQADLHGIVWRKRITSHKRV